VKLLKDVGSCTVETKTPTNLRGQRVGMTEDGQPYRRTTPLGMFRVQRDETPAEREFAPVTHRVDIVVCHEH
jgi:hypothetical protein